MNCALVHLPCLTYSFRISSVQCKKKKRKKKEYSIHISACYRLLLLQDTSKIKAGVRTGITHNMPYKMFSNVRLVQIFSSEHFLPFYGYMLLYKRHGKILKNSTHKDSTDYVKFAVHCIKFVTTNFQSLCPNLSESKPTMP